MAEETQLRDFPSLFSVKGKVVVITGGSRGLGLIAASALLQAGAAKVFISSRKADACVAACAALNALPNRAPGALAIPVPADSATLAGVRHLVAEVARQTDHVDVLLANAGASWGERFDSHPDEAFAKVMDLNVRGVFNAIREFAPLLEKRATVAEPSRVIITASVAGLVIGTVGRQGTYGLLLPCFLLFSWRWECRCRRCCPPFFFAVALASSCLALNPFQKNMLTFHSRDTGYSASKAAVIHLGRNLAIELGPRHITVNSICPGLFPTKMSNGLMKLIGGTDELAKANPMKRLGEPDDIAGVVVFLASRAGAHVNGATITVDGGQMWTQANMMTPGEAAKL
ncbi:hypothetical protein B0T19DRAFT_178953 [Cercophora scortea]|uniref:Uncharacterized protein n=1 Tax=Cercophora scortea TaxID=314031 RepID=A0AAE0IN31_9PEZI|nr:hypothetical protein B0T19DRAFT_178953 [Cercophora scortea]